MNIASNPWSFISSDPATAAITAVTGLTLNANGTVTVGCGALTFNAGADKSYGFTVVGAGDSAYNGYYKWISGASGATSFVMQPQFPIPVGTAQNGSGTIAQCLYPWEIRVEDISWQNPSAAGQLLDLRDRNGNIVWQATAQSAGNQNRGKIFWISGLTPIQIQSGVVVATIN